ncbi:KIAA0100 [Cordylochernes scorpioides]|uniref:KIAA0100 n=1 Tax=Cordylochernes scorpioides TaxID=51811 RepID=A0ABY6JY33_9ARAC|nr:KIAA0100 [Cordylochernes scorpioides]
MEDIVLSGWIPILLGVLGLVLCLIWPLPIGLLRLYTWYLEWSLTRVRLRVQKVGYFSLHQVKLLLSSGSVLEIEHLWISSSLFDSRLKSLLAVCVSDLRYQGQILSPPKPSSTKATPPLSKKLDVQNILSWIKFLRLSLYFNNASAMQFVAPHGECLFHLTLQEFSLHLASLPNDTDEITAALTSLSLKVFQHYQSPTHFCLAQASLSTTVTATIRSGDPKALTDIKVDLTQPEVVLYDSLPFSFSPKQPNQVVEHKEELSTSLPFSLTLPPYFPSKFSLEILNATLQYVQDSCQRTLITKLGIFSSSLVCDKSRILMDSRLEFHLQNMSMTVNHANLATLDCLDFATKLEEESLDLHLKVTTCHLSEEADNLIAWAALLASSPKKGDIPPNRLKSKGSFLQHCSKVLANRSFNCSLELKDSRLDLGLAESPNLTLASNHMKLTSTFTLSSSDPFPLRDADLEFLMENTWSGLGEVPPGSTDVYNLKKSHFWGMPLVCGVMLVQLKQYTQMEFRMESMVDNLHFEWSPPLCRIIKKLLPPSLEAAPPAKKPPAVLRPSITFQFNCSNVNLFFLVANTSNVMVRLDTTFLDTHKMNFSFEGLKMVHFSSGTSKSYPCQKTSEIKNFNAHVSNVSIVQNGDTKEYNMQILDEIQLHWNTNLHMTLFTLISDLPTLKLPSKPKRSSQPALFNLALQGPLLMTAKVSSTYTFFINVNEFTAHQVPSALTLKTRKLEIGFNGHVIFDLQQVKVSCSEENEEGIVYRTGFKELELKQNKTWSLAFENVKITFPYQFNFAEAFTEKTISIVKWLKILHNVKKSSSLPSDLIIKAKSLTLQLSDDPFEVKLRDNYVLLRDEYHESLERKKMLDEKVDKLRVTHLLLPTAKLDELYSSLLYKNSEIYIQRSQQLYQNSPPRDILSLWTLDHLEIVVLADPSIHGTEKVIQTMKEIDTDSPFPEEGLEFTTLWCRMIRFCVDSMVCQLRNFSQPYMEIRNLNLWGRLCGAEQAPTPRSRRLSMVEISKPWDNVLVERNMCPLKFYHDLLCSIKFMCAAYGPSWEPVMNQVSLAFEYVSRPSLDPSPTLPFWDKIRLLMHGRLTFTMENLVFFLHASLDPYNTTEEMEISWTDIIIYWTNGKILKQGNLDIYVHTASKYDDCRLLHMPNLKLTTKLEWLCLGNPNDHHSATPCAPDKLPEYSINQTHDSYRAFRSQNLSLAITLESKIPSLVTEQDIPSLLLYSSTLRWFENLKMIMSGIARLTRKGKIFENTRPRKPQFSRHYKSVQLSLNFPKFQICYWTSFAQQKGLELLGGRLSLSMKHSLSLAPHNDDLIRRPQAVWETEFMNCDLGDSEMWLNNSGARSYFFSVNRVSYGREALVRSPIVDESPDNPTHRLVIHGLKGAWTESNRDVIFSLYDTYNKNKTLKKNLATDALKALRVENPSHPKNNRSHTNSSSASQLSPPISNSLQAETLIQHLLDGDGNTSVAYTELENSVGEQQQLHGVSATKTNDVLYKNWLIELVNSQVMLKGPETLGYVIVSASKTEILQKIHQPTWKDRRLYSKTSWVGSLECMQYYATVGAGELGSNIDSIMWLSLDNIEQRQSFVIANIPDLVGSGHSVGGIVSSIVGGTSDPSTAPLQLQRIVFRCSCQFYYVSYGQNLSEFNMMEHVPPVPEENDPWNEETCVDSFTLTHHDLDICTNSLQYAMILDIVNNLLLYVEPRKKEANERLQRMRFQLQLCSIEDQKKPILQLQNQLRALLLHLRTLEKEAYQLRLMKEGVDGRVTDETGLLGKLDNEINKCKEQINNYNEELTMMINCYKETQIHVTKARQRMQDQSSTTERHNQVCFKHARWKLTDKDGQLGIADLVLNKFVYSKVTKSNDSVEHLLELGYIMVNNLLPNQFYCEVLYPTDLRPNAPLERQRALRIFCRENAPVGGISVKEHLEVNEETQTSLLRIPTQHPGEDVEAYGTLRAKKRAQILRNIELQKNDIEKMKERARKNQTFLYIKIPEVPIRLSYKGDKIKDLSCVNLVLPTLEYHNQTWTWLDLLMELKKLAKRVFLPQAIKQKLLSSSSMDNNARQPKEEEDKATLILGTSIQAPPEKKPKRSLFRVLKK